MNKHHASTASVLLWLQLMQERMSETQCALFAADLANLHLDYRTNKFLYWIFNNSTDSELTQFCKSHYGTEAYAKMIATVDDSYFEQYLSKKHHNRFGITPLLPRKRGFKEWDAEKYLLNHSVLQS